MPSLDYETNPNLTKEPKVFQLANLLENSQAVINNAAIISSARNSKNRAQRLTDRLTATMICLGAEQDFAPYVKQTKK